MADPRGAQPMPLLGPHALAQSGFRAGPVWAPPRLDAVVLAETPDGWAVDHHSRSQARPDAVWSEPTRLALDAVAPPAAVWVQGGVRGGVTGGVLGDVTGGVLGGVARGVRTGALHVLAPLVDGVAHLVQQTPLPVQPLNTSSASGGVEKRRMCSIAAGVRADADGAIAAGVRADAVAAAGVGGRVHALVVRDGRAGHVTWSPATGWVERGSLPCVVTGQPTLVAVQPAAVGRPPALVAVQPAAVGRTALVAVQPGAAGRPAPGTTGGSLLALAPTGAGLVAWRFADRWERLGVLAPVGTAAAALVRDGRHVLALIPRGAGLETWRWTPASGWVAEGTTPATGGTPLGAVAAAPTALGSPVRRGESGWLQALVQEGGSIYQLQRQVRRRLRDARGVRHRWARAGCVRLAEPDAATPASHSSVKLAQITGDTDTQPWPDGPRATLSGSERASGLRGTDLGVRVEVGGNSYLLCGDTHWTSRWRGTTDAIAHITDDGPVPGLPGFTFHGGSLALRGPATVREYDVPLDSFTLGDDWLLFASSHHFARHQTMGRSVLARALDDPARINPATTRPLRFHVLATVSDYKFVNLSCQWVDGRAVGAGVDRDVLALWGSGSYRADDLRLALFDPQAIAHLLRGRRRVASRDLGLQFWAGTRSGRPVWSAFESEALPVLPGAFGEVSVRWVGELGRYTLLGMTGPGDPAGHAVWLRVAETPWGPWSPRLLLFDWIADGMSFADPARRFIRALAEGDPVGDAMFGVQARSTGGAYAPYLFDARADGGDVVLRYTLSTWNPYQIVLMEHRLGPGDLAALGVPDASGAATVPRAPDVPGEPR